MIDMIGRARFAFGAKWLLEEDPLAQRRPALRPIDVVASSAFVIALPSCQVFEASPPTMDFVGTAPLRAVADHSSSSSGGSGARAMQAVR